MVIKKYESVELIFNNSESKAVNIAITNLHRDLIRVLQCRVRETKCSKAEMLKMQSIKTAEVRIFIGTVNNLVLETEILSKLKAEDGSYHKEAFLVQEKEGNLFIAGSDRRGTIYGIYDFCEWLGVSPWYFFADVPVKKKEKVIIEDGYFKADHPSVEYRGIFINDEEELEHWVWEYMGEETIGVKTYEKIFELLLRLKLNYIWPAMHVNSFNLKKENGELADRMGIVVGTSHCDMLMRSNNREWKPWLAKKGYTDVEYDFSIPGRNREILEEYWKESVQQNREFEVSYTVGMRGIHDSGFETRSLKGLEGEELLKGKIELLESVIKTQEKILADNIEEEPLKIFVPYKEVLELYDNGLEVPDDLTLIWTNDNYGYVRRYPGEREKARKSGNGIYYHNSYWAPPGASYLFICSIPMAHTRNELLKAYNEGIQKIWVTNFGAIKPLEQQLSFYARLAWEADGSKERNLETEDEKIFLTKWIDSMFSGSVGCELAPMLLEFDQLTNVRKIEHMEDDCFSQTAYGDEAAERMHRYEYLCEEIGKIYDVLREEEKDAFFQLVLMKVQAAYFTYGMYYYADRSRLCMRQGKASDAKRYTEQSHEFDMARQKMLHYYNHVMSNGKWNRILTPEDFPPPRTAMYPSCCVPLKKEEDKMIVTCWNNADSFEFTDGSDKWIELANAGEGELCYKILLPDWLIADCDTTECAATLEGVLKREIRILLRPNKDDNAVKREGVIIILCDDKEVKRIHVTDKTCMIRREVEKETKKKGLSFERIAISDSGRCVIEASDARISSVQDDAGWKFIANLARGKGSLLEAKREGACCECNFYIEQTASFIMELHRFPTLSSIGRIRIGVSMDDGEMIVVESFANDEHKANWKKNILNNVDKLYCRLGEIKKGMHTLKFTAIDAYFSISRAVLYDEDIAEEKERLSNMSLRAVDEKLPKMVELESFCKHYYGDVKAEPRPVLYLPFEVGADTLADDDIIVRPSKGKTITPGEILDRAKKAVKEKDEIVWIDTASALAQTDYARNVESKENVKWSYCDSPSYSGTGLAMYIEGEGLSWEKNPKAAPSLHFKVDIEGGHYYVWVRTWQWGTDTSHYTLEIDENMIPQERMYNGQRIWKYASEHVWKWAMVWECELEKGEHEISLYSLNSKLKIDHICMTKGELPPADLTLEGLPE